jgi:nicotinate-nucleotide adenylyltransferase
MQQMDLDEVLLLIDANPPGKTEVIDFRHRLVMAKLAADSITGVSADKLPLQQQARNHTIASARSLRESFADAELVLLMGADSFMTLGRWSDRDELFEIFSFGVAGRVGSEQANIKELPGLRYTHIEMPYYQISSSSIRHAIEQGGNPEGLHKDVYDYIKRNQLYRNTPGSQ